MSVLEIARKGYAAGLSLLPVCEDGTKKPDVSSWLTFKTTRPSVAQMRDWDFAHRCGLGVIAGPVSGHVECWDFDEIETFNAFIETAMATGLEDIVQRISAGYEDRTPGSGVRWLVRYPESIPWRDCTLARRPGRAGESAVKTLIELPTFSIIAPSNGGVHPSGRPYVHVSGDVTAIASYTDEERASLVQLARSFDQMPRPEPRSRERTMGTRPGDDYNRRTTWQEVLIPAGWCDAYTRGETTYWRRPDKTQGISATTNHAGGDCLYVFSSSTQFAADTSYTKFGAYAVLVHGGNYPKAAKQLAAEGYGDTAPHETAPAAEEAPPPPGPRTLRLTPASEIPVRPVRWLWEHRLSLGTLSLLGGREGVGKTILAYTLAADLTRGRLPGIYLGQPRSVLVAATEDSWEHTIGPRLIAAGADRARVFRVDVVASDGVSLALSLPQDVTALEQVARDVEASALILDPLLSRLDAHLDTHKDAEVRRALEPLSAMADAANVTVLGLIHVNKSASSDALSLLMASRAFPAVARNVLFVMTDPDDQSRRLLGQAKNNLGRMDLPTLVFQVANTCVASTPDGPVWTGQLRWLPSSTRTLSDAIERAGTGTRNQTSTQDAAVWLEDYLTSEGGTAAAETVRELGAEAGHSRTTLYRAHKALNLTSDYRGFPRKAHWVLPLSSSLRMPGTTGTTETTGTTATTEPQPSLGCCCPSPKRPQTPGTTDDSQPSLWSQEGETTGTTRTTDTTGTGTTGTAGTTAVGLDVDQMAALLAPQPRPLWELAKLLNVTIETIDQALRRHPNRFERLTKTTDGIHRWACVEQTGR